MHLKGFGRALLMAEKILDRHLRVFLKGVTKIFDSLCEAAKDEKINQNEQLIKLFSYLNTFPCAVYFTLH